MDSGATKCVRLRPRGNRSVAPRFGTSGSFNVQEVEFGLTKHDLTMR